MWYRLCRWCRFALPLIVVAMVCSALNAEPVAVALFDGRVFVGEVDAATSDTELWLRVSQPGGVVRRPIAWDAIALARRDEEELSTAELKQRAAVFQTVAQEQELPEPAAALSAESITEDIPPRSWQPDYRAANFIAANRAANLQVCSLWVDASVANLNRTVEADGLVLTVCPLNGAGQPVPCDGTLNVELVASLPPGARRGTSLPTIASWSLRLTAADFGPNGYVFKLPFQGVHPEFNLNIGPLGLVHARLSVPGNGAFEASASMVRIRPYSAVRDRSQQINGQRFMDVERIDRRGSSW